MHGKCASCSCILIQKSRIIHPGGHQSNCCLYNLFADLIILVFFLIWNNQKAYAAFTKSKCIEKPVNMNCLLVYGFAFCLFNWFRRLALAVSMKNQHDINISNYTTAAPTIVAGFVLPYWIRSTMSFFWLSKHFFNIVFPLNHD